MDTTATRRAIYGKLASDTTLNSLLGAPADGYTKAIYYQVAPQDAEFPYVVFQKQVGIPAETFSDPEALESDTWMVKSVDRNTTADAAEAILKRVVDLLNDSTLSISGSTLLYCRRQSDQSYPEVVQGVTYNHCVALMRLVMD